MKICLFYFEIAIKITGSAQNYRVGPQALNVWTDFFILSLSFFSFSPVL